MKHLFVLTADTDAKVVMQAVLQRHQSLGIRPITFDVDRHTMCDSGVVKDGPELVRRKKGKYEKVLLIWDHHGCGWERVAPEECMVKIQSRLDGVTWSNHSGTVIIVPELEEWLWHNQASLCRYLDISNTDLEVWVEEFAKKHGTTSEKIKLNQPKELFEFICLSKVGRTISPKDFEEIAKIASLVNWQKSLSFNAIVSLLQSWFPVEKTKKSE